MSTLSQPHLTPQWKEEVNRRIAAHKTRKCGPQAQDSSEQKASPAASRAAEAAARVAARYAKAPTYSQMQAEEARVAVRAAEIATKVALDAQAVAESALAELHAASNEQPSRRPVVIEAISQPPIKRDQVTAQFPAPVQERSTYTEPVEFAASMPIAAQPEVINESARQREPFGIRWDPDLPVRRAERIPPASRTQENFEIPVEDWWSPVPADQNLLSKPIAVEAEPAHANLIQFPRELIATRKIRPRLAENQTSGLTEAEGQLSIFEVDPASISTLIEARDPVEETPAVRTLPDWSGMRLDAQPFEEQRYVPASNTNVKSGHLAPLGLRLMATVVDGALILAGFVAVGFIAAANVQHPPVGKPAELIGVAALAIVGMLYFAIFFSMGMSTPGMKYAGIGLCTFDDQSPTRAQLRRRLCAMVLSLVPIGLGVVWSVFDEEHLSWHDRYSQTYLRKC